MGCTSISKKNSVIFALCALVSSYLFLATVYSCASNHRVGTLGNLVVPIQLPIGTKIATNKLPNAPKKVALMVVSDCQSCALQVLKLARHPHEVKRFVVTSDPKLVDGLKEEWPGVPVTCDSGHHVLPEYCFEVTPQMFLVSSGRVADEAVGAIQCAEKWDEWNR